jgi:hypothetical protein
MQRRTIMKIGAIKVDLDAPWGRRRARRENSAPCADGTRSLLKINELAMGGV